MYTDYFVCRVYIIIMIVKIFNFRYWMDYTHSKTISFLFYFLANLNFNVIVYMS